MARTRIPADVVVLLRGGLYTQLICACESAPCGMPAEHSRRGWADVLSQIEDARTALDAIGWDARQQAVEVELDRAMVETLEDAREFWDWLAHQTTSESAEGRKQAATKAATIKRFLDARPSRVLHPSDSGGF